MPDIFVSEKHKVHNEKSKSTHHKPPLAELNHTPGYTKNPLAAFSYYPRKVNFSAADEEEHIVLLLRRHPITNIPWMFISVLLIIAPFFLSFFPFFDLLSTNYQIVSMLTWYLITLAYIIERFLSWYFNVYIITDERIFDVDFVNLVYREISEANLEQIQDVTVKIGSVIRTVFDYGDIQIQTASEIPQIEFDAVPHPDRVAKVLRELRVEEEQEKLEGRVR